MTPKPMAVPTMLNSGRSMAVGLGCLGVDRATVSIRLITASENENKAKQNPGALDCKECVSSA